MSKLKDTTAEAWRELADRESKALHRYGSVLSRFGRGESSAADVARSAAGFAAAVAIDRAVFSWRLVAASWCSGASLAGVEIHSVWRQPDPGPAEATGRESD